MTSKLFGTTGKILGTKIAEQTSKLNYIDSEGKLGGMLEFFAEDL